MVDTITGSEIINIFLNQGFAIAVAVYLLWERTTITKQVLGLMSRLTSIMDKLEERFPPINNNK